MKGEILEEYKFIEKKKSKRRDWEGDLSMGGQRDLKYGRLKREVKKNI